MPLNKKQASLLRNLIDQGILDQPNNRVRKLPPLPPIAPVQNRSSDYASYLMANAVGNKGVARAMSKSLASTQNADDEEKSMLSKLFDTLMIPNNMMADVGESIANGMDEDGFLNNLGDTFGGAGKAVLEAGQSLTEDIFSAGLSKLPFVGDKVDQIFEDSPFHKDDSEKQTFQNVLHDKFNVNNKFLRHGGGLALDVLTDPTTFLGTGLMKIGSAKKAKTAVESLDDAAATGNKAVAAAFGSASAFTKTPMPKASVAEHALQGNPAIDKNILGQLPDLNKVEIPKLPNFQPKTRGLKRKILEDGMTKNQRLVAMRQAVPNPTRTIEEKMIRRQADFERAMTSVGKVADTPSKINMRSVNNVIQRIQAGELPKVLPKVPSATGEHAVAARDIADDFIDAMMGQKKNIGKKITWRGPSGKITTRKLPPELTANQQLAMFDKILVTAPKNLDNAITMLRSAEDHLISLGVHPIRHEGVRVRLSDILAMTSGKVPFADVLNDFGKKSFKNMDPTVREAIQTAAAYRTVAMSDILENATKYAEKARRSVADNYVGRQAAAAEDQIVEGALTHMEKMGATKEELRSALNLVKDVVNIDKLPAENFLLHVSNELDAAVAAGKVDPKIIDKFNNLVADSLGITKANISSKISGSNVVDQIMTAFATWWGKGNLLNPARGTFDAGMRNAQARAEKLRRLSQEFTKDEIKNAWKAAAGNGVISDPRVAKMAGFFREYMDEVLKVPAYGMKLDNPAIKHLSTVQRSQMMMKDVNRHLKQMNGVNAFQFTDASIGEMTRDAWGIKRNFGASGEGWAASWARWDPNDPLKTLYDIDLALERATKEYAFLDNFAFTFGSLTKDSTHNFKILGGDLDRISDFYVPEEVGRQMLRVMNDIHAGQWTPHSPLGRFHGKALRVWKTGVTIYLPSHHIRNGIGDTYLMWLAGHNDPRAFIWGKRIMHSQKGRYNEVMKSGSFSDLAEFTGPDAVKWAATNGKDVILNVKGTKVTAEQLYANAWHRGLLKDANQLEDIFGESRIGWKPLGGKVHGAATAAAEYREHYIRLSHFTAAVNKSLKRGRKNLDDIFDDAAAEVRKWHPDGTDLTKFEQKYMRSVVPFYSWIRKSTPLLVESLVTRPAKALAYPRGIVAIQNMMGIDATVQDPFPDDQLFPEWIRGYGVGPIGDAESPNPFAAWWGNLGKNMLNFKGDPYGYTVVNPSNPFIDAGQQFMGFDLTDTGRGVIDSLSPFLKVPLELGTDSQFTGAPIYKDSGGQGLVHYLSKQLPQTAPFQRITDFGDYKRPGKESGLDIESLLNTLTAMGLHGTAPYIKTAEFEKKNKLKGNQ